MGMIIQIEAIKVNEAKVGTVHRRDDKNKSEMFA